MRTSKKLLALALITSLALGGCKTAAEILEVGQAGEANPGPCPRAFAIYDASRIVEFRDTRQSFANVGFTGEINKVRSLCRYCLLYTSPSPRDQRGSRMPSSA